MQEYRDGADRKQKAKEPHGGSGLSGAEEILSNRISEVQASLTESQVRVQASNVVLRNAPEILRLSGMLNENFQKISNILLEMTNEILTGKSSSDKK